MRLFICAALLCASAHADLVATSGADELRLMNGKCDHTDILETLKPEYHDQFKRAQAVIGGRVIRACWIEMDEDDAVYVQAEGGAGLAYPRGMFADQGI